MSLALCRGCGAEYPDTSLADGRCYPCSLAHGRIRTHADWATSRALARKLDDAALDGIVALRERVARRVFVDGDGEAV